MCLDADVFRWIKSGTISVIIMRTCLLLLFTFLISSISPVYTYGSQIKKEINIWSDDDLTINCSRNSVVFNVRGAVNLHGRVWRLSPNCELKVTGGCLTNGVLVGNKTVLNSCINNSLGVKIEGNWSASIIRDAFFMFDRLSDNEIISNINALQSKGIHNTIYLNKKEYFLKIDNNGGHALRLLDNTDCILNSKIKLKGNNYENYSIIYISESSGIRVSGRGEIVGDVGYHRYIPESSSEWGMGILIVASSDISIHDINISRCTGDGIYIGGYPTDYIGNYTYASKNIKLVNVTSKSNRRQGLSIISVDGLLVDNCKFINTGSVESTPPSAGIDIEPNVSEGRNNSVRNILIKNCTLKGNKGYSFEAELNVTDGTLSNYENVVVDNCIADGQFFIGASDVTVKKSKMESVIIRPYEAPVNPHFDNCTIEGGGVIIREPHDHKQLYNNRKNKNGLLKVVFSNTNITYKGNNRDNTNSLITIERGSINGSSVLFDSCRLEYPQRLFSNGLFTNDGNVKVKFVRCDLHKQNTSFSIGNFLRGL